MVLARSTNQTSGTYRRRAGFKICGFRSGQGSNTKYTAPLDCLGQHLTVARFKDVQGQGSMREQRALWKEQRAQGVRNLYWIHRKSLSRRNAKARRGKFARGYRDTFARNRNDATVLLQSSRRIRSVLRERFEFAH